MYLKYPGQCTLDVDIFLYKRRLLFTVTVQVGKSASSTFQVAFIAKRNMNIKRLGHCFGKPLSQLSLL